MAPRRIFPIVTLLFCSSWALGADEPKVPAVGQRVRISVPTANSKPLTGSIVGLSAEAIELQVERQSVPITVPRSAVTRMELSRGRRVGRGAGIGALVGLGAGLAVALLGTGGHLTEGENELALIVFVPSGLVLGTAIGAAVGATERWRDLPLEPRTTGRLQGRNPVGVSISVRF